MAEISMVEKVAEAIYACKAFKKLPVYPDDAKAVARAAIEAMRKPSTEMQRAVSAQWGRRTWAQYEEVIDAALNEEVAGDSVATTSTKGQADE